MESLKQNINDIINNSSFVYDELFSYFSHLKEFSFYTCHLPRGFNFYRARKNENFTNFENISDLYAPPSSLIKNYSRANTPFQSVLYVSDNWKTNLAELKLFFLKDLAVGDVIWVTQIQFSQIQDLNIIILPDFENEKMNKFIDKIKSECSETEYNFWKFINSFFSKAIKPTENNSKIYQLTSAFCNAFRAESRRSQRKIDGIMYTSVEDKKGFNLVLNPNVIKERKIVPKSILKRFLCKSSDTEFYEVKNFDAPINIDFNKNKIEWK